MGVESILAPFMQQADLCIAVLHGKCPLMPLVACHPFQHSWGSRIYPGLVLELSSLDLGEIAEALADQTDYEHRWLINPQTGEIVFWTADTGIDGQTPVDLDDLNLVCIDPPAVLGLVPGHGRLRRGDHR